MPNFMSRGERIFQVANYTMLILLSILFVLPLMFVLSTSFVSEAEQVRRGTFVLFPEKLDLTAYRMVFRGQTIWTSYINTLFRVTVGVALNLFFTSTFAYVLAKPTLPGRTFLTLFIFVPLVFSGGIIPLFLLIQAIGLQDSRWAMILPSLVNPFWLLIMRNFFMTIPIELEEAAIMDGASPFTVFLKIVLPLSMPILVTIGLFYAVFHWNAWFDAAIYINSISKQPVQLFLRNVLQSGLMLEAVAGATDVRPPSESLKAALTVITATPILLVYPFIQKYFIKGMLIGGIKG